MVFHRPLSFIDYYCRSWKAIKDEPADVYHSHDVTTLPIGYIAKRKTGGKLVYDSHELFTAVHWISLWDRLIFRLIEGRLIHRADEVITVNNFIGEELSRRYKLSLPHIIMNCPPKVSHNESSTANSLRLKLGVDYTVPIILYVGGLAYGRGLHNLILSVPHLNEGILTFLGWGKQEEELRDFARDQGLRDRVFFTPPVPPSEVVRYIASASVGVVTPLRVSLNHYYSLPNKIFDYINAGLPVVSSNFPALRAVVEGYHLGKICDPEDPRDIAAAINWVLSDKDRYEEMRKNALEAAKIFNWENESKKLLDVYERLESNQDGSAA